jgi:hypothetical protein
MSNVVKDLEHLIELANVDTKVKIELQLIEAHVEQVLEITRARYGLREMPKKWRKCPQCKALYRVNGFSLCPICNSKQNEAKHKEYSLEIWVEDEKGEKKVSTVFGANHVAACAAYGKFAVKQGYKKWIRVDPFGYYINTKNQKLVIRSQSINKQGVKE